MAARFFVNGTVNTLWSNTANWSTTSGGATGSTVPGTSDVVTLDENSPNCNIDFNTGGAVRTCSSFTVTSGYVNTLTFDNSLVVAAGVTLGTNMQPILGNGTFRMGVNQSITSNGIAIPNLAINTNCVITFNDPCVIKNVLYIAISNTTVGLNGSPISIYGGFILWPGAIANVQSTVTGSTVINLMNYNGRPSILGTVNNTINITSPTRGY